ncbi:hypothetical protein BC829DRAFT_403016 [Chytridium lagenaria]|nr:hypothetical protein BC829DRAFT_403016 [Chytridium lagenaria]
MPRRRRLQRRQQTKRTFGLWEGERVLVRWALVEMEGGVEMDQVADVVVKVVPYIHGTTLAETRLGAIKISERQAILTLPPAQPITPANSSSSKPISTITLQLDLESAIAPQRASRAFVLMNAEAFMPVRQGPVNPPDEELVRLSMLLFGTTTTRTTVSSTVLNVPGSTITTAPPLIQPRTTTAFASPPASSSSLPIAPLPIPPLPAAPSPRVTTVFLTNGDIITVFATIPPPSAIPTSITPTSSIDDSNVTAGDNSTSVLTTDHTFVRVVAILGCLVGVAAIGIGVAWWWSRIRDARKKRRVPVRWDPGRGEL